MEVEMKNYWNRILWGAFPKKLLSRLMGKFARHRLSKHLIPYYIQHFDIDLTPVKRSVDEFEHLLDFFTREYRSDARPIDNDPTTIISPVDGVISQIGKIQDRSILQVKGITYTLDELLCTDQEHINKYVNGNFVTIYLSPRDYHRIHMPYTGKIEKATHVSGALYPVNQSGVRFIPRLFAINERLITYIQTEFGEICMIKVGATNVGSIKVVYDDKIITNRRTRRKVIHKHYQPAIPFEKGNELGRFEFGSTVILLFEPNQVDWVVEAKPHTKVQMGQGLASILN